MGSVFEQNLINTLLILQVFKINIFSTNTLENYDSNSSESR